MWGGGGASTSPLSLSALRLRYCLSDLKKVQGRVLEVGCGAGSMAKAIKKERSDLAVVACDISTLAIERARKNPSGVAFRVASAYRLPYKNGTFAAVLSFDLLEHLDNPLTALKEMYRVLSPNGVLHAYVPCEGEWSNYVFWFRKAGWEAKRIYAGHIRQYSYKTLSALFERAGYTITKVRWSNHVVNQLFDGAYFTFLLFRGQNVNTTLEGYALKKGNSIGKGLLSLAVKTVAILSFTESVFFPMIPGHGVHITAVKAKNNDK